MALLLMHDVALNSSVRLLPKVDRIRVFDSCQSRFSGNGENTLTHEDSCMKSFRHYYLYSHGLNKRGRILNKIILTAAFTFFVSIAFGSIAIAQMAKHAKEIAREGRFIAYENGPVLDTKTGLLWAAKDDGKGMDEQDAKAYFENYRGGGYTDWRMPTVDELEAIYDHRSQNKQGYHVTKLIDITGEWVWCSEGSDSVTIFNFKDGSRALAFFEGPGSGTWYSTAEPLSTANRALPVRDFGNNEKKKTALHLPQEKEDEEVVKTAQPPEELKSNNTIEIAVFPWRFNIMTFSSYANEKSVTAWSIDGLSQVLNEYKLVVPKFSYYNLGNAKNIKGNPLTKAIVNDIWIKKSIFSERKVNLDLIHRLGKQLQVDAVLIYSIYIAKRKQTADIILIDIGTKKAYSKTEGIYVNTLSSDIKNLTRNFFIHYVNEKYKSHPNYEMIFWDFIKNSQNTKVFQQYLIKFPDGTFAGLAKLRIQNLSSIKP